MHHLNIVALKSAPKPYIEHCFLERGPGPVSKFICKKFIMVSINNNDSVRLHNNK
jgi:hypothetical protein